MQQAQEEELAATKTNPQKRTQLLRPFLWIKKEPQFEALR